MPERCPVCGFLPCRWTGGTMGEVKELSHEDWQAILRFLRWVQLPFLHGLIHEARLREGGDDDCSSGS